MQQLDNKISALSLITIRRVLEILYNLEKRGITTIRQ